MNKNFTPLTFLVILLFVACLTGVTSDIYTPSFREMVHDLNAPMDQVQWSMAIFMLGVSLSQLVYGPVSEGVGRRSPLLIGLGIMLMGSIICLCATSITVLLIGRFVQGSGAGACACLWRSIFRDSFDSTQMAKYGAYLGISMTFAVPAAPALGGYLQEFFGWRASFFFLILYSLTTVGLVFFFLKETSEHHHKDRLNVRFFKHACGQLLSSPTFMGYTLCTFLTYGAFFSWFVVGPVLLIENIGLTPVEFGWVNLFLGGISMTLAGIFNGRLVGRFGKHWMLRLGWGLMFLSGGLMLLLNVLCGLTLFSLVVPIFLFFFGVTLIWPSAFAGAFAPFGKIAGYAGALYSFMQIGGGAIVGWLSSFLPTTGQIPLAILFLLTAATSWIIFERIVVRDVHSH